MRLFDHVPWSRVEISYDVYDLYKIASFMMIPSLTDVLVRKGIDVFGPRCDARDCRLQLASLLFRAQGDGVLMDGVIKAIRSVCRSPGILLVYPMMYKRETWDAVMLATKQSFMLCPGESLWGVRPSCIILEVTKRLKWRHRYRRCVHPVLCHL